MRRSAAVPVLAVSAALLIPAAPAGSQAPPPELGTWVGSYRDGRFKVSMRIVLRRLQIGKPAGTTRYRAAPGTCRGRLRLRARSARGYVLRDRLVSGSRDECTNGDTVIVKVVNGRLRVRVRNGRDVLRVTLRRV